MMCLSEFRKALADRGHDVAAARIHYVLDRGYVSKPPMGADLRFRFTQTNVDEFVAYLETKREVSAC